MKQKCYRCSKLAVWNYEPADGDGLFCDDCVNRGCSCNVDLNSGIEDTDEKGRFYPCCEYIKYEFGIDEDEEFSDEDWISLNEDLQKIN